jgi:predicted DNA-binding protein
MDPFADIDLDAEAVWLDGAWYTREALAHRIKDMIEAGDFRVSRPSQALERLEAALGQAQLVSVRFTAELSEALDASAARLGRPVGLLVREAVAYYLAAAAAYGAAQQAEAGLSGAVEVDVQDDELPAPVPDDAPARGNR